VWFVLISLYRHDLSWSSVFLFVRTLLFWCRSTSCLPQHITLAVLINSDRISFVTYVVAELEHRDKIKVLIRFCLPAVLFLLRCHKISCAGSRSLVRLQMNSSCYLSPGVTADWGSTDCWEGLKWLNNISDLYEDSSLVRMYRTPFLLYFLYTTYNANLVSSYLINIHKYLFYDKAECPVRCFVGQIFRTLFVTRDILLLRYQMALAAESGWLESCWGSRLATAPHTH
jgi:hypothetical protein